MKSNNDAIIGNTGFIGSNLSKILNADGFNTSNIQNINYKNYQTIYCCAPGAEKWKINKEPYKDLENINSLIKIIKNTDCNRFVLFSTIDVNTYTNPVSYGSNRLYFENQVKEIYPDVSILRLPGLFGPNLKKNYIFDLQNKKFKFVNLNSSFQWLNINRAINYSLTSKPGIHELYTEPIETLEIVSTFFPKMIEKCVNKNRIDYNIVPENGYFQKKEEVIKELESYLKL